MSSSTTPAMPASTPPENQASTSPESQAHCGACGAPAQPDQRYCLSCGSHRVNAHDPVALYLSEASAARARVAAARARQAEAAKLRRLPKVSPIFATVMVVVALLVGIEIGHSSSSSSSSSGSRVVTTSSSTTTTKPSGTGGSAVDKVEKSKGKSYVQQENDLPTSVSP